MAAIPTLDPAQDENADGEGPAPKKRPWLLIIAAAVVVVACIAVAGFLLWERQQAPHSSAPAAAQVEKPKGPPLYVALDPPFVTNFDGDQSVRFLQITAQVMTHDSATQEMIKANDPVLRNDLLLLFSNQKAVELQTRDGREHLRAQALDTVRHAVTTAGGHAEKVEAVLFTSFVMQ